MAKVELLPPYDYEWLVGRPAVEVVRTIFDFHRNRIKKGSFIKYAYRAGEESLDEPHYDFYPLETASLPSLIDSHFEPGHEIGLSSKIELIDGSNAHLLMLDFDCPVSPHNLSKISRRITRLNFGQSELNWVILLSGDSYNAYCLNAVMPVLRDDRETILDFGKECHRVLDFDSFRKRDEIIHGWHLFHGASKGELCLRLTNSCDKKMIPQVVAFPKRF
jgi:hypothetical protein